MKTQQVLRTVAAFAVVAAVSAGVTTAMVAGADSANNAPAGTSSVKAGAASPTENTFVPVRPCRLVDSRTSPSQFSAGETRSYKTQGNTASQGGATSCGVPSTATAIELDATAVDASFTGFLRIFPAGGSEPNSTFMNYVDGFNASNAGTVQVTPGTGANLKVKNYGSETDLVVEVLGYYVPGLTAVVRGNGTLSRGNGVTGVVRESSGVYRVGFNRDVSGCAYSGGLNDDAVGFGSNGSLALATDGAIPSGVFVQTYNSAGTITDLDFHLVVTC